MKIAGTDDDEAKARDFRHDSAVVGIEALDRHAVQALCAQGEKTVKLPHMHYKQICQNGPHEPQATAAA